MKFILMKVTKWMGVGICNKRIIKNNNFSFIYDKIDKHGTFILMSNGIVWSGI
jgi:hypothetical protein